MSFSVNILGCGSASPTTRHMPSCQVLEVGNELYMIDCGEGAQLQMKRYGMRWSHLHHIFISHLHGDHVLGLPGLLSTLALNGNTADIHVYIFAEGATLVRNTLDLVAHDLPFNLVMHAIETGKHLILEDNNVSVETFSLCHLVPAVGFLFREKPHLRHLKGDLANYYKIPNYKRQSIREGADFVTADGTLIPNKHITTDPDPSLSYAYCSDTLYNPGVVEAVKGVDVLYHEATYGDDKADKAALRGHSTARQAGIAAREAGAKHLIIGHFSSSYNGDESTLLNQARQEFDNVTLAKEGLKLTFPLK